MNGKVSVLCPIESNYFPIRLGALNRPIRVPSDSAQFPLHVRVDSTNDPSKGDVKLGTVLGTVSRSFEFKRLMY